MLPWLMERGEVPVAEMAARFELSEAELIGDLELAALCGLPPFIDEMIDVFIDEGVVFAGVPRLFTKPLRLTAPEGFALLSSGRAAMQLPGADPDGSLARALDKLAGVLGDDGVVVDVPQPPATADLAAAVNDNARLSVRYWSANRDEATEREITPRSIFLDRGHWYVIADDSRSGESRTFRIDRFEQWERTGVIDPPAADAGTVVPPSGDRVVRRQRRAVGGAAPGAAGAVGGGALSAARRSSRTRATVGSDRRAHGGCQRAVAAHAAAAARAARRGAGAGRVARPRRRRGAAIAGALRDDSTAERSW